jgi:hypothetical protein
MSKRLTRLQKTGALVPMALLVTAWGVAVGNSGLAGAIGGVQATIPEVPANALEQPAAVSRIAEGLDPQAGAAGTMTTLATNGIPSAALYAYHHAQNLLADADASCNLPWNLLAAIGRVESNHGRTNGNALTAEGIATPGIYGEPAKGIKDTDHGKIDKSAEIDRPVGPMQMMPSTWTKLAVDSDADGTKDPQDIDDAATTTGVFLCSGTGDLSTPDGVRSAVSRFNNSGSYTDLVMKISEAYANGQYSQTPDGYTTATILTSQSNDQTLSKDDRKKAKEKEDEADNDDTSTGGGGGDHGTGGSTGGGTGGTNGGGTGGGTGGGSTGGGTGGGSDGGGTTAGGQKNVVGEVVKNTSKVVDKTVKSVNDTVKKTTDGLNKTLKNLTKKKDDDKSSDDKSSDDKSSDDSSSDDSKSSDSTK